MFEPMEPLNNPKKPVEQVALQDWHPADIKAALEKAGWTLRQLSIAHGYSPDMLKNVLREARPRAEAILAAAIGVAPQVIWPSRYHVDGTPRSGRNERGIGRRKPAPALDSYRVKSITASTQRYVEVTPGN